MTAPIILEEKLRLPAPAGLSRPRLHTLLLDDSSPNAGLVVAPPGSGKSTLLAQVAAFAGKPVAWFRVTDDDVPESWFVAHLARALGDAVDAVDAQPSAAGPAGGSAACSMTELLSGLAGFPRCLLILDDLHEIAGSPAERALERFLALRPPSIRVVIGSRRLPDINIPRLRVSGALAEVTGDDLRFRSWEVEELFVSVYHEPLSPEAAAALTRRTGGWAAALQLFHLATSGRSSAERAQIVADLGGRSRLVRSYLTRNVLADLPPERRTFLLLTSSLGLLTAQLCDALLETTGSAEILEELEQGQLFTSSQDDGRTFRYHEVLRSHLEQALIEELGPAGARGWYARSAALLEEAGRQRAALRCYARAEDWPSVTRLLRDGTLQAGAELFLPPSIVETDPWIAVSQARRQLRTGAVTVAVENYRQAEQLLDESGFRDRCRAERSVAMSFTAAGDQSPYASARAGHWTSQIRSATRTLLPGPSGRAAGTWPAGRTPVIGPHQLFASAVRSLLAGDFVAAASDLGALTVDPGADPTTTALARLGLLVAQAAGGAAADVLAAACGQLADDADIAGLPWVARLARGLQETTSAATGRQDWRLAACRALPDDCDRVGDPWGAALLRLASAVATHVAGAAGAAGQYADAAQRFAELDAPVPRLWAECLGLLAGPPVGEAPAENQAAARVRATVLARDAQLRGVDGAQAVALAAISMFSPVAVSSFPPVAGSGVGSDVPSGVGSGVPDSGGTSGPCAATPGLPPALAAFLSRSCPSPADPDTSGPGPARPISDRTLIHREVVTTGPVAADPGQFAGHAVRRTQTVPDRSPAQTPGAQVQCFGGFRIRAGGRAIDLSALRPRSRGLLRLICLTPAKDLHREWLIDTLWPDADLAAGTRRLQVAVSSVRRALAGSGLGESIALCRHGDAYRVNLLQGSTVDVLDFETEIHFAERACGRGDLDSARAARQKALDLYQGDLLPEDGSADPIASMRERLRFRAASAATALAVDLARIGRRSEALSAARRAVELDRYQDVPWRLMTELYTEAGDLTAAERNRQHHGRVRAELGAGAR